MKKLLVIRNQNNHYLGRHGEWLDGSHVSALFRTEHRDAALNELFETNIRDFDLRGEILECEIDKHGYPVVELINPIIALSAETPLTHPADEKALADNSAPT